MKKPSPVQLRVMNILADGGKIEPLAPPLFRPCAQVINGKNVSEGNVRAITFHALYRRHWIEYSGESTLFRLSAAGLTALAVGRAA